MKQNYMARKTLFMPKKTGLSVQNPPLPLLNQALSFMPTSLRTSRYSAFHTHNCRLFAATQLLSIEPTKRLAKTPLVSAKNSLLFRKSPRFFLYCPLVPKVRPHTLLESSVCGLTSGLHKCTLCTTEHRNGRLRDSGSSAASWSKATLSLNWGAFSSRASNRNNL